MSTKYNSPEYLRGWVAKRLYPDIHSAIFLAATTALKGKRVLDICCSYGLLGQHLKDTGQFEFVCGMDAEEPTVNAAMIKGIEIPLMVMKLTWGTSVAFTQYLAQNRIDTIVARRAFPELFSEDPDFGREMSREFHNVGVKEILIEGRVVSPRTTNALGRLENEVALFSDQYEQQPTPYDLPNIAYLRARTEWLSKATTGGQELSGM